VRWHEGGRVKDNAPCPSSPGHAGFIWCLATFRARRFVGAHAMNATDVNLYLVGFMGTGKSTVGRVVAQKLGFELFDSDHEIERQQGRAIPEIFAQEGEAAFRAMERSFIEQGHPAQRTIVSCGGGLVVQPGMLPLLQSKGVVICLHASLETILARTARQRNRPLLNVENPEERIRTLYAAREPIYRESGTMILTDGRPLSEVVAHVTRAWRRDAGEFARQHA
jgi:shikimate kinase